VNRRVLVLAGNYRPTFRDMVAFRNSGKDALKVWEADRNTTVVEAAASPRPTGTKGVYRKEFGPRTVVRKEAA
jgi:hypothetical protein